MANGDGGRCSDMTREEFIKKHGAPSVRSTDKGSNAEKEQLEIQDGKFIKTD